MSSMLLCMGLFSLLASASVSNMQHPSSFLVLAEGTTASAHTIIAKGVRDATVFKGPAHATHTAGRAFLELNSSQRFWWNSS